MNAKSEAFFGNNKKEPPINLELKSLSAKMVADHAKMMAQQKKQSQTENFD